ncbi:MAG: transcriptional regulator [Candidatus Syntrophonatronum acetioxidans]|uniref:Transcriptional regulator n=1 Tax=Candidatus Syntrophonatronum acetioxidans TaxID=1795816 RepID=A0A424YIY8_9FIRM|nr:MAG: transcriptional regulator [Candidatus Syntrophonatronum acetioxidans]
MLFCEKLDFLMNITNTANSSLARHVSLDPSFISRLRKGTRNPAREDNYVKLMAAYLARNLTAPYQRVTLAETLGIPLKKLPSDQKSLSTLIYQWLAEDSGEKTAPGEDFVEELTIDKIRFKRPGVDPGEASGAGKGSGNSLAKIPDVFFGIEGRREAVLCFLTSVLEKETPSTLLLLSEESIEWLTGSREFMAKWSNLLARILMKGHKIKIIHKVSRTLDELFSAIDQWLPLYITGSIEAYFYPKVRDGIFKRTLFIAPGIAALSSTSVDHNLESSPLFYSTHKKTIEGLTREFNYYLGLCRPLMGIFTGQEKDSFGKVLQEFEEEEGHRILKSQGLSTLTMPVELLKRFLVRLEEPRKDDFLAYHKKRVENFQKSLQDYTFTELISPPSPQAVEKGEAPVNLSHLLFNRPVFYEKGEYQWHLENMVELTRTYNNYQVYFSPEVEDKGKGYMIYAKEDVGVLVGKTSPPAAIFAINESNLTAAFWDYLSSQIQGQPL